jgi:hypothetical protein
MDAVLGRTTVVVGASYGFTNRPIRFARDPCQYFQ